MDIAVISDLHLGPGDVTDQFGHNDYEFITFLKFLESNFEKIILLGDIYECLMSREFGKTEYLIKNCQEAHKEIVKRFNTSQYTYVHGNHDQISSKILNTPEDFFIKVGNENILFTHGHQYDSFVQDKRIISEFGAWLGGWIIRIGMLPVYKIFATLEAKYGCGGLDKMKRQFENLAVTSAKQRKADIVVTGHTHLAAKSEYGSQLYLNSGTCSEGNLNFLSINTNAGNYKINYCY